jgi:hypothetical protein
MRYLLTFSTLLFAFNLCAQNTSDTDKAKETEDSFNSSASDFEGGYFGFGVNLEMQKTSAAEKSAYSSRFGGVSAIGYQKVLCGNCFIGAEVGVDFGSGPKRLRVYGQLNNNSDMFQQRRFAISQIFSSYFRVLCPYLAPTVPLNNAQIDGNVWRNFLKVNRYLGGSSDVGLTNPDGTPGPAISNFINGAYRLLFVNPGNEPLASYPSFIEQHVVDNLTSLGNGNISLAIRELRNFIVASNSDLANTLKSIGENDIGGLGGSGVTGAANPINPVAITRLLDLFAGTVQNFNDIGIVNAALFSGDINRVNNAIRWALGNGLLEVPGANSFNIKTKATFAVSPYITLKLGYFFDEIRTCLYVKAGIIRLNGKVSSDNPNFIIKEDSFRKVAPLLAVGLNKNWSEKWGVGIELSQTIKVKKNLTISTPYGYKINNNTTISKTNLAITVTYKL